MSAPEVLTSDLRGALVARLTAMADDELILGHRDSQWTGHAPLLEEDIALANLAQDEIGHALLWLEARAELDGTDPDQVVFFREPGEYRNVRLVELPRGDWAFTMVRQYLFDAYEAEWWPRVAESAYAPLAAAAAKVGKEELFHLRHSGLWLERLGRGTEESAHRAQAALERLWPYVPQLFAAMPGDELLRAARMLPDLEEVERRTRARIEEQVAKAGLILPTAAANPGGRDRHGEALVTLLIDMQSVARADREASLW